MHTSIRGVGKNKRPFFSSPRGTYPDFAAHYPGYVTVGGVAAPATYYIFADLEAMTFEILGVEAEARAAG